MAVYKISRYPRTTELRDGRTLTLRPLQHGDADALLAFFRGVPEDDRFLLKDDVTSPRVIGAWVDGLDYDRALPLLAVDGDRIVADAVLIRHRSGSRAPTAELRIVVDPAYRNQGLGVRLMQELADIAYDAELESIVFELVRDVEDDAIEAVRFLGAVEAGSITDVVKDLYGKPHDLVYMKLPLGKWWKWSKY